MEPQGEKRDFRKQLIAVILSRAEELDLSEKQIVSINQLYWSSDTDVLNMIGDILSDQQYRTATSQFIQSVEPIGTSSAEPDQEAIKSLVEAILDNKLKDKSVVEIELATKVAEKLIGWSKIFLTFVAVPLAIILFILTLFGWSKFDDVRRTANEADESLKQAQAKLKEIESSEVKVGDLANQVKQQAATLNEQIAALQKVTEANSHEIAQAKNAIQDIETKLGGFSAMRETGNKPAGSVLSSPFTKLYGPWAFNKTTAGEFVAQPNFPWHDSFEGLTAGNADFDSSWKKAGEQEPEQFKEAQRAFALDRFYNPAAKMLKSKCGLDVSTHSHALNEVIFALAVRTGPGVAPIVQRCQELQGQVNLDSSTPKFDEELIRESYQQLIPSGLASTSELADALRQLSTETRSSSK